MDLQTIIATRARVDGDLLMVDTFLNHRVDPAIIASIGDQIAAQLDAVNATLVLTAEASGIPPALAAAERLGIPMVYAKKFVGPSTRGNYSREVASPTKGIEYRVEVRRHVIDPHDRAAIVDDFLARGRTAEALGQIVEEAEATVAAMTFVVEKTYAGGRAILERHGWPVTSLVRIASLEGDRVVFDD
jgi:xanthine phosphoribosyltransferase